MQTCYCCDDPATSREHVPPKCIFPKNEPERNINYRNNLLTVPSCETHNQTKTHDDEYLRAVLTMCIGADEVASQHFSDTVLRGAKDRPRLLRGIVSNSQTVYVKKSEETLPSETIATEIDRARVVRSLEQVALGVFFHQFGVRYFGKVDIFPFFLADLSEPDGIYNSAMLRVKNICDQTFQDLPRMGSAPDIFYYQTYFDKIGSGLIHLVFYGGVRTCCLLNE
jgi:hypothetical protein